MVSRFRLFSAPTTLARVFNTPLRPFSTESAIEARRKWRLGGVPTPRSILEDDTLEVDLSEDNDAVDGRKPNASPVHLRRPPEKSTPNEWKAHRQAIKKEFPNGWSPPRKLSREAMDGLRQLHRVDPQTFSTPVLAEKFKISPEAVRRILKSKWEPSPEKRAKLMAHERALRNERAEQMRQLRMKEHLEMKQLAALRNGDKLTFE